MLELNGKEIRLINFPQKLAWCIGLENKILEFDEKCSRVDGKVNGNFLKSE